MSSKLSCQQSNTFALNETKSNLLKGNWNWSIPPECTPLPDARLIYKSFAERLCGEYAVLPTFPCFFPPWYLHILLRATKLPEICSPRFSPQKQNKQLQVLPLFLSQDGFRMTVCSLPSCKGKLHYTSHLALLAIHCLWKHNVLRALHNSARLMHTLGAQVELERLVCWLQQDASVSQTARTPWFHCPLSWYQKQMLLAGMHSQVFHL